MGIAVEVQESLAAKFEALFPHLDERRRRLVAGAEARALGHGGIRVVAGACSGGKGRVSDPAAQDTDSPLVLDAVGVVPAAFDDAGAGAVPAAGVEVLVLRDVGFDLSQDGRGVLRGKRPGQRPGGAGCGRCA